jgi:hypothetical protein
MIAGSSSETFEGRFPEGEGRAGMLTVMSFASPIVPPQTLGKQRRDFLQQFLWTSRISLRSHDAIVLIEDQE